MRAVSDAGIAGNWSQPRNIMLSIVPPPSILNVFITRPRRRMNGSDLIVTAVVNVAWSAPSTSETGFAIIGYDGYVGTEVLRGYVSPPSSNLQMFGVCWPYDTLQ